MATPEAPMKCLVFKGLAWETDAPAPIDAKGQFYELGNSWAHHVRASDMKRPRPMVEHRNRA